MGWDGTGPNGARGWTNPVGLFNLCSVVSAQGRSYMVVTKGRCTEDVVKLFLFGCCFMLLLLLLLPRCSVSIGRTRSDSMRAASFSGSD